MGMGCDGVDRGGAMREVCVDICDIDVCCVKLFISVFVMFSLCL